MKIISFDKQHIEQAASLFLTIYEDERRHAHELPLITDAPELTGFAGNGLGVAAFDGGGMLGFLGCCEPFDHAFCSTDATGVFSPFGANAAVQANRSKIYAAMYQAAGARWVKAGAVSHAICLPAHDEELQRQFYNYGFGLRCMDAMRCMDPIDCAPCTGFDCCELPKEDFHFVYPLYLALHQHYRESPFFMNRMCETEQEFCASCVEEGTRYFAAKHNGTICAYLGISDAGETFVASGNTYRHIIGAYCLPEYRGRGIYQNLLNFTISKLKAEGYTRLGVDFESMNPTARGFWLKYFTPYTHGVVRRIDERIIQQN